MALPLSEDDDGLRIFAVEIHDRFHAMKTYGKQPEALESIIRTFKRDLGHYPVDLVMKAISTFAQRNNEFPTTGDIAGLIRRNGREPIDKTEIIAINRKNGDERTPAEWETLRLWQAEQSAEWDTPEKINNFQADNVRLRKDLLEAKRENKRLAGLLREANIWQK